MISYALIFLSVLTLMPSRTGETGWGEKSVFLAFEMGIEGRDVKVISGSETLYSGKFGPYNAYKSEPYIFYKKVLKPQESLSFIFVYDDQLNSLIRVSISNKALKNESMIIISMRPLVNNTGSGPINVGIPEVRIVKDRRAIRRSYVIH
jgi:hypothetical protein